MKTPETPRFLLLQARDDDDDMALHEQRCFVETLQVPAAAISVHNLLYGAPPEAAWRGADALLVGGSGSYSFARPTEQLHAFVSFLEQVVLRGLIPTFASCFGFQGIVIAGGGTVISDPEGVEVGTHDLTLTAEGRRDPLFGALPERFKAQLGHKDSAIRITSGMTCLACSERVRYEAVRVDGLPVVATQFHPELSRRTNTDRYLRYWEHAGGEGQPEDDPVMQTMAESPEASALLRRWLTDELLPLLS